jgi:hypothetical protein
LSSFSKIRAQNYFVLVEIFFAAGSLHAKQVEMRIAEVMAATPL